MQRCLCQWIIPGQQNDFYTNNGDSVTTHDLRALPAYSLAEAAHYLRLPIATMRAWALGRTYPTKQGSRRAPPVITLPKKHPALLSFFNLAEAHVLVAMTHDHEIHLQRIRGAIRYLREKLNVPRPLIDRKFETDGRDLFIRDAEQLINVSEDGQAVIRDALELYLSRVQWDESGLVSALFPFTGRTHIEAPKSVRIDPHVSFGRPVLAGTSIPTSAIAERFKAGETEDELARDFNRPRSDIEEAIRCELTLAA